MKPVVYCSIAIFLGTIGLVVGVFSRGRESALGIEGAILFAVGTVGLCILKRDR